MRFIYPNLIREMMSRNITAATIAPVIEVSTSAVYRRLRGETDWKLPEVIRLCQFFDNSNASELFLRLDIKS